MSMDHLEWQKRTALSKRERDKSAAEAQRRPISDDALDLAAAAYVGATAAQVKAWRGGR